VYNATRLTSPERAEKIKKFVILTLAYYSMPARKRPATYLSRDVRFKGWWRNWREVGLQHLEDAAMIRWCGFSKEVVFELADEVGKDPAVASLLPGSRFWKRADPKLRPTCDVLDLVVLALREIATLGYQHQLCTDMGIHMGLITKYLHRGKAALRAAPGLWDGLPVSPSTVKDNLPLHFWHRLSAVRSMPGALEFLLTAALYASATAIQWFLEGSRDCPPVRGLFSSMMRSRVSSCKRL
jgi:hypothetical protein